MKLSEYVWKESLRVQVKLHPEELKPLSLLDTENLDELISETSFMIYQKDSQLDLTNGCVFFQGFGKNKKKIFT